VGNGKGGITDLSISFVLEPSAPWFGLGRAGAKKGFPFRKKGFSFRNLILKPLPSVKP
jgi:hypothetical protein